MGQSIIQSKKEIAMNTRISIIISIVLLVSLLLYACGIRVIQGSGRIQSEQREVSDFTGVNFTGLGELTIIQGETEGLTIETDDNLLPYITSTVSGGTLTIGFDNNSWLPVLRPTQSIRYTLTVKTLNDLELSGAGTVYAEQLTADSLMLTNSGAGEVTIDQLAAGELSVTLSGAGTVELAGQATTQTVEMSGLGNYQAGELESQSANLTLSGAGNATVWVNEQLDATLSGVGSIEYYGSPQTNASSSGVGSVQSLGDK
jgi:hypothetical protein